MTARMCVVGSINMDLVVSATRFPEPGETLLGGTFATHPGGKGANQAVAAARLGAEVSMVGCLGELYGEDLHAVLVENGVDAGRVRRLPDLSSGVGVVTVVPGGENAIIVASGANARLDAKEVIASRSAVEDADAVVLQLETTTGANEAALQVARKSETMTILNAAPVRPMPYGLLGMIDVLVVNRVEAEMLTGRDASETHEELLRLLLEKGAREVVITLGPQGAIRSDGGESTFRRSYPVQALDTTACGDAFVGAYAVARTEGMAADAALDFACAAGGLAATVEGAMPSLPTRAAVEALLLDGR